jgi:hypothetical protein
VVLGENGVEFERVNVPSELYVAFFSTGYFISETLLGKRH